MPGNRRRLFQRLDKMLRDPLGFRAIAIHQQAEFVTSGSSEEAPFCSLDKPLRDKLEQLISYTVTERVVDDFEVIQVEAQGRQRASAGRERSKPTVELFA
jgi:hypothetical protein